MRDDGLHFGTLQRWRPSVAQVRPDRDPRFAVVALCDPRPADLPIFVELDTFRDIDRHARSDVRVELGGVLLGTAWQDAAGELCLAVRHNLRANFTRNRAGSLTFTHATWSDITRRRRALADELRIVGWYHTHPGWGVYLSGWDQFICRHFFSAPWDVALVLDPCRGQRDWFQWSSGAAGPPRRVGGYFLVAADHRRGELERFAASLCGPVGESMDG